MTVFAAITCSCLCRFYFTAVCTEHQ